MHWLLVMETELSASYPTTLWIAEKSFGSIVIVFIAWLLRGCWRTLRANQKLALADYDSHSRHSERRGLLLPIRDTRDFRNGGRSAH